MNHKNKHKNGWRREGTNDQTGFGCIATQRQVSMPRIFNHLFKNYVKTTDADLLSNKESIGKYWDLNTPIQIIYKQIEDGVKFAALAGLTTHGRFTHRLQEKLSHPKKKALRKFLNGNIRCEQTNFILVISETCIKSPMVNVTLQFWNKWRLNKWLIACHRHCVEWMKYAIDDNDIIINLLNKATDNFQNCVKDKNRNFLNLELLLTSCRWLLQMSWAMSRANN